MLLLLNSMAPEHLAALLPLQIEQSRLQGHPTFSHSARFQQRRFSNHSSLPSVVYMQAPHSLHT